MGSDTVTISFLGDISLNNGYNRLFREGVRPFGGLANVLSGTDLVAGNLECLSAGSEGENLLKKPRLKTDLETLSYLKQINLGVACLAHNHIYDNLEDGFRKTTGFLQENGIHFLGASLRDQQGSGSRDTLVHAEQGSEAPSLLKLRVKGMHFAFFNYVTRDTNPSLPPEAGIQLSILDRQKVLEDLDHAREVDYRILILHWGGSYENSYFPGPGQLKMAREFMNGGADLIVGHHSHTLQPVHHFKGKSVFFSLGNFCFDDIRSDGRVKKISMRRWKESAVVNVTFSREGYRAEMVPFRLENLHTVMDRSMLKRYRKRQAYFKLIRFSRLFWFIYYFGFRYLRPVFWELRNPDTDKNFWQRLAGLNREKIKGLFR
jgi:hypothetical protein